MRARTFFSVLAVMGLSSWASVVAAPAPRAARTAARPAARPAAASAQTGLARTLDAVVDAPRFADAWWGVEVRSLRSGQIVYGRNAERNLKPASTMKLVTTAAALDTFGPDARLRTTVETAGRLDEVGRILGDVFLVGRGDPDLSGRFAEGRTTAVFDEMAEALRQAGVRRIEGRLLGHEGLFAGDRRGDDWSWDDLVWGYGAEVSALSFNDNVVTLTVTPAAHEGEPIVIDRDPPSAYYRVASTAVTGPRGSARDLTLKRDFGTTVIRLSGAIAAGSRPQILTVAIEDPARYAATVFTEVLAAKGIVVAGGVDTTSQPMPAAVRVLAVHESPSMAELVKVVNKVSQNLHAEMLLRLVGAQVKGDGTAEAGLAGVDEFLRREGVDPESWAMQDGSGLSRSDLVTPHGMAALLAAMDHHRHAASFRDSLPVAGVDGTLETRLERAPARGNVVAKTGTIRHVNALGGYVTARSGDRFAFYAAVNHHTGPASDSVAALDAIASALAAQ
ncbi:MAG TPA: D-alanyl-D-alanine carboxypeptidase/D-alanyl-D-alanine-endopeptidase [Vicinamibacteria bacterium]|nr:D-alanyl-D-alanine carboxypeptidase/D-alanyl-D-alanine-endopeptidase [Vicinamibacteria bacterium]